jgi:hypothetical protein
MDFSSFGTSLMMFSAGLAFSVIFWPLVIVFLCVVRYCLDDFDNSGPSYFKAAFIYIVTGVMLLIHFGASEKPDGTLAINFVDMMTLQDVGVFVAVYLGIGIVTIIGKFWIRAIRFRGWMRKAKQEFFAKMPEMNSRFLNIELQIHDSEAVHHALTTLDKHLSHPPEMKIPAELTTIFARYLNSRLDKPQALSKRLIRDEDGNDALVAVLDPKALPLTVWGLYWPIFFGEFLYRPAIQVYQFIIRQLSRMFLQISLRFSSASI